jgi:phosphonate degradation associated HDIG domain protein
MIKTKEDIDQIAGEVIGYYLKYGDHEYAGEKVTQLQHMVQAAQLAEKEGYDEEVILASFLHDIGHICIPGMEQMGGFGTMDHEEIGAAYLLRKGFSKRIARLVQSHVEAKRYLTWKDPAYYARLSAASKKTLEYQGGPMLQEEAEAFEKYPLFDLIIKMRQWDEMAKVENQPIPDMDHYRSMIKRHLEAQSKTT